MLCVRSLKILVFFIFFLSFNIYAQDKQEGPGSSLDSPGEEEKSLQAVEEFSGQVLDLDWVWGEVVEISTKDRELKVRYLDYDKDLEIDASFFINDKSEFENLNSIEEIKPGDSAGIDYYVNEDGKNIIKAISIEGLNIPDVD